LAADAVVAYQRKVRRAKRLHAGMVKGDLSAVNAIGIAIHIAVKSSRQMRVLYANVAARSGWAADLVAFD
jgi:hypothetical protein